MKTSKIADKILSDAVKEFLQSGQTLFVCEAQLSKFPNVPEHLVYAAIKMLEEDGLVTVSYANDLPAYSFSI